MSDTGSASNTRIRKSPSSIAFYGVQLNASYPPEKFKEEHEKLATRFVKIDERIDQAYRQKWNDNDSILVETIQFNNSNDRIITQVYKDMDEHEVDSTIGYLKQRFPQIEYQEGMKRSIDGIAFKNIRMRTQGISISIAQNSATQYSFTMTDYLETIKLIIRNAASGYVFRDDIKIY